MQESKRPKASVIVPVYKDVAALNAIVSGLLRQTESDFELIIAEDDESEEVAEYVKRIKTRFNCLQHLSQKDLGFRKTVAVNRAVVNARSEYLIFLDGDCIPYKNFVRAHFNNAEKNRICTGRRVDLGPVASRWVKQKPGLMSMLENPFFYLLMSIPLHIDGIRSYEVGLPLRLFHWLAKRRHLGLMGCNFSCYKNDMIKINGYDEDFVGSGGEDDDLEWRFRGLGIVAKNIKFLAPVYHLRSASRRGSTSENYELLTARRTENLQFVCKNGLDKYLAKRVDNDC